MSEEKDEKVNAIIISQGWKPPAHVPGLTRQDKIFAFCESLLGGKAWIRDIGGGGQKLVTTDPQDTLLFHKAHDLAGHPRYDWTPMPDGSQLGYLRAEAQAEADLANQTPEERAANQAKLDKLAVEYAESVKRVRRWQVLEKMGDDRTVQQTAEYERLGAEMERSVAGSFAKAEAGTTAEPNL